MMNRIIFVSIFSIVLSIHAMDSNQKLHVSCEISHQVDKSLRELALLSQFDFATLSKDTTIRLYRSGSSSKILIGERFNPSHLVASNDKLRLAVLEDNRTLCIYDTETGRPLTTFWITDKSNDFKDSFVAFANDGNCLNFAGRGDLLNVAYRYDVRQKNPVKSALGCFDGVDDAMCKGISIDRNNAEILLSDLAYNKLLKRFSVSSSYVIAFSRQLSLVAAVATAGCGIKLYSPKWEVPEYHSIDLAHEDRIRCLKFSPDGKLLASLSDSCVKVWDSENGNKLFAEGIKAIHPQVLDFCDLDETRYQLAVGSDLQLEENNNNAYEGLVKIIGFDKGKQESSCAIQ